MKLSDGVFANTQILGYSATKFVIYPATEFYHWAADTVSTSVGMDIFLGVSSGAYADSAYAFLVIFGVPVNIFS